MLVQRPFVFKSLQNKNCAFRLASQAYDNVITWASLVLCGSHVSLFGKKHNFSKFQISYIYSQPDSIPNASCLSDHLKNAILHRWRLFTLLPSSSVKRRTSRGTMIGRSTSNSSWQLRATRMRMEVGRVCHSLLVSKSVGITSSRLLLASGISTLGQPHVIASTLPLLLSIPLEFVVTVLDYS